MVLRVPARLLQGWVNVLIHRKYFLHAEAFVIHLDQPAGEKGIGQGLGRLSFAWKGGQEAPAVPQRGIPELNPTEVPHSWGGWRSLCRAHGAAPRVVPGLSGWRWHLEVPRSCWPGWDRPCGCCWLRRMIFMTPGNEGRGSRAEREQLGS